MAERSLAIRLSTKDGQVVKRALQGLGKDGEKALKRISTASKPASRGLLAVNAASREGAATLRGYASRAGSVGTVLSAMGPAGIAAAVGIAGVAAAGGGLVALANNASKAGDMFDKMSLRTGITAENLSTLQFAAERSGAEFPAFEKGLQRMTRNALEASRGTGESAKAFKRLGVSATDSTGQLRPTYDMMLDLADGLQGLKSDSERAALAQQLFGRAGAELLPLLREGKDGIKALQTQARALGVEFSTKAASDSAEYQDALTNLSAAITGLKNDTSGLLPYLTEMIEKLAGGVVYVGAFTGNLIANLGLVETAVGGIYSNVLELTSLFTTDIKRLLSGLVTDESLRDEFLEPWTSAFSEAWEVAGRYVRALGGVMLNTLKQIYEPIHQIGIWVGEHFAYGVMGSLDMVSGEINELVRSVTGKGNLIPLFAVEEPRELSAVLEQAKSAMSEYGKQARADLRAGRAAVAEIRALDSEANAKVGALLTEQLSPQTRAAMERLRNTSSDLYKKLITDSKLAGDEALAQFLLAGKHSIDSNGQADVIGPVKETGRKSGTSFRDGFVDSLADGFKTVIEDQDLLGALDLVATGVQNQLVDTASEKMAEKAVAVGKGFADSVLDGVKGQFEAPTAHAVAPFVQGLTKALPGEELMTLGDNMAAPVSGSFLAKLSADTKGAITGIPALLQTGLDATGLGAVGTALATGISGSFVGQFMGDITAFFAHADLLGPSGQAIQGASPFANLFPTAAEGQALGKSLGAGMQVGLTNYMLGKTLNTLTGGHIPDDLILTVSLASGVAASLEADGSPLGTSLGTGIETGLSAFMLNKTLDELTGGNIPDEIVLAVSLAEGVAESLKTDAEGWGTSVGEGMQTGLTAFMAGMTLDALTGNNIPTELTLGVSAAVGFLDEWGEDGSTYQAVSSGMQSALQAGTMGAAIGSLIGDEITAQKAAIGAAVGSAVGSFLNLPGGGAMGGMIGTAVGAIWDTATGDKERREDKQEALEDFGIDLRALGGVGGMITSAGGLSSFQDENRDTFAALNEYEDMMDALVDVIRIEASTTKGEAGRIASIIAPNGGGDVNDWISGTVAEIQAAIDTMAEMGIDTEGLNILRSLGAAASGYTVENGQLVSLATADDPFGAAGLIGGDGGASEPPVYVTPVELPPVVETPPVVELPPVVETPSFGADPAYVAAVSAADPVVDPAVEAAYIMDLAAALRGQLTSGSVSRSFLGQMTTPILNQVLSILNEDHVPHTGGTMAEVWRAIAQGNDPGGAYSRLANQYGGIDITAASGYRGWLTKPTHILAGEQGPEYVDIRPPSQMMGHGVDGAGSRARGNTVELHVHINKIETPNVDSMRRWVQTELYDMIREQMYRDSTLGRPILTSRGVVNV